MDGAPPSSPRIIGASNRTGAKQRGNTTQDGVCLRGLKMVPEATTGRGMGFKCPAM